MAAHIAQRLTVQEQEIRRLNEEIGRLLELGLQGSVEHSPNPVLEQLRAENEKLKYRISHLQRSLREEQERARPGQYGEPGLKDAAPVEEPKQQNNKAKEKGQATKGENSVGGKPSACEGNKKNEKKAGKEVDGHKQEQEEASTTQDFRRLAPKERCPAAETAESGRKTDFLQLIHRREYWDTLRRPWKVIFPLEDTLTEHASAIILVRLDEHRDIATQEQLEHLSDPNMPRWLHKHNSIMYRSPSNTWKILFQNPLPDNYLLYLKRDNTPVKFFKDTPTELHPLSHHLLK